MDGFLTLHGVQIKDGILEYLILGGYDTQIVFDISKAESSKNKCEEHPDTEPIFWLKLPTEKKNEVKALYINFGNEATLSYDYGDVCLIAKIPSKAAGESFVCTQAIAIKTFLKLL